MTERYFAIDNVLRRYELTVHIKKLNSILYEDLVVSGILYDRIIQSRNDHMCNDVWIHNRQHDDLSLEYFTKDAYLYRSGPLDNESVVPLWFYENSDGTGSTVVSKRKEGENDFAGASK